MKTKLKQVVFALSATVAIASLTAGTVSFVQLAKTDFTGIRGQEIVTPEKAQQQAPEITQEATVTTNSIVMPIIAGAEYSLDEETWQDSNIFSGLTPGQAYTVYVRMAETEKLLASDSVKVEITLDKLTQEYPEVEQVEVIFTTDTITMPIIVGAEYSINDGNTWQNSNVFDNLTPGQQYIVYIRYAETTTQYASDITAVSITLEKLEQSTPSSITETSKTPTSITMPVIENIEYSLNNETWQDSNVFNDLTPGQTYTVFVRYKETNTQYASDVISVEITLDKLTQDPPQNITIESTTPTSITMTNVEGVEYSLNSLEDWQDSNIFEGLTPGSTYTVYVRMAETDTHYASGILPAATMVLGKFTQNQPELTQVEETTPYSINLTPGSTYTVYYRLKETATHYASPWNSIEVTLDKLTLDAPQFTITSYNATSITVTPIENAEYSLNGTVWQDSNVFENLTPGTMYTIYARYKETATNYQSEYNQNSVTLPKETAVMPNIYGFEAVTDTTITIPYSQGVEYSLNGSDWQDENTFSNLTPNTEYTVYYRTKETATLYPSETAQLTAITCSKIPGLYVDGSLSMTWQDLITNNYFVVGISGLSNNVLQRGSNANLTSLTGELVIDGRVTEVEEGVFENTQFSNFVLSPQIKTLKTNMFKDCLNLTSFTIPETVTTVRYSAFSGCDNLKTITILSPVLYGSVNQTTYPQTHNPGLIPNSVETIYLTEENSSLQTQTYWSYYAGKYVVLSDEEN